MFTIAACLRAAGIAQQDKGVDLAKIRQARGDDPVRDGVKLHTEIYTPKDAKEPLPIC